MESEAAFFTELPSLGFEYEKKKSTIRQGKKLVHRKRQAIPGTFFQPLPKSLLKKIRIWFAN